MELRTTNHHNITRFQIDWNSVLKIVVDGNEIPFISNVKTYGMIMKILHGLSDFSLRKLWACFRITPLLIR